MKHRGLGILVMLFLLGCDQAQTRPTAPHADQIPTAVKEARKILSRIFKNQERVEALPEESEEANSLVERIDEDVDLLAALGPDAERYVLAAATRCEDPAVEQYCFLGIVDGYWVGGVPKFPEQWIRVLIKYQFSEDAHIRGAAAYLLCEALSGSDLKLPKAPSGASAEERQTWIKWWEGHREAIRQFYYNRPGPTEELEQEEGQETPEVVGTPLPGNIP